MIYIDIITMHDIWHTEDFRITKPMSSDILSNNIY